jgi:hypothetical protein
MAELKPQLGKNWPGHVRRDEDKPSTPWKGVEEAMGAKPVARRRWASGTLGATPPRDGPAATAAAEIARLLPPVTRKKRREPL